MCMRNIALDSGILAQARGVWKWAKRKNGGEFVLAAVCCQFE